MAIEINIGPDKKIGMSEFHKGLDNVVAMFIQEKITYENKKTLSSFSIMDFLEYVYEKTK